jgi:hypothetical protein
MHQALELASDRHHAYSTLEHLLLALLDDESATAVMSGCGVDLNLLRTSLINFIDSDPTPVDAGGEEAKPTTAFQRVVQRAVMHVQNSGRDEITGANVLVAMYSERESHAIYFLQEQNMSRLDAVNFIGHGITKHPLDDTLTTSKDRDLHTYDLSLWIEHPEADLSTVPGRLGFSADRVWKKGDARVTRSGHAAGGVYPNSCCTVQFKQVHNEGLQERLTAALLALEPNEKVLGELSNTGATFRFLVGRFSGFDSRDIVDWSTLGDLGRFRISLDFRVAGAQRLRASG